VAPQPFLGEIRAVAFPFAPSGWALCDGKSLGVLQHNALFKLIGTTYGGNGTTTFKLPDLRGRVPVHAGLGRARGQSGGVESVKLTISQMPAHTHTMQGSTAQAASNNVTANVPATLLAAGDASAYGTLAPFRPLSSGALTMVGDNLAHENRQPFLAVNFVISLFGPVPPKP
jgi:microcystin-dependent protein